MLITHSLAKNPICDQSVVESWDQVHLVCLRILSKMSYE